MNDSILKQLNLETPTPDAAGFGAPDGGDPPEGRLVGRVSTVGLRTKLVGLLMAFALIPLAAISLGYVVSRRIITGQASQAVESLTHTQAVHVATELDRQRLLLRTIAGQLPSLANPTMESTGLARLLVQGLPEGGVFDGLRLVDDSGRVLASVALLNTAPHWPTTAPAADWRSDPVVVHQEGDRVLAYLVGAAVPDFRPGSAVWIEGHVRGEDFQRIFLGQEPLLAGATSVVYAENGRLAIGVDRRDLSLMSLLQPGTTGVGPAARIVEGGSEPTLLATATVPGTAWGVAVFLPVRIALASLSRLRNTAIAGGVLLLLITLIVGTAAAQSVTKPLRQLALAARRFGREGAFHPIPEGRSDELGIVVASFNAMTADRERSQRELERLHAGEMERAQQLATVGELASGVAHEIRNPLTGVRGALELALADLSPEEPHRPLLEEAQVQLGRIEAATTQLLTYARPPIPREIPVAPGLLVERAATIVEPKATSAKVRLHLPSATEQMAEVSVDPELLVQVLVNLMLNGVQAMPRGGDLTVWVEQRGAEVWIGVRDTGPGIPSAEQGNVFRPFYTTKSQGTGLGLSISRQIVERHGGRIHLNSPGGGGADFVVILPLHPSGA